MKKLAIVIGSLALFFFSSFFVYNYMNPPLNFSPAIDSNIAVISNSGYCNDSSCVIIRKGTSLDFSLMGNFSNAQLRLLNRRGQTIKRQSFSLVKEGKYSANMTINSLPGNYFIVVAINNSIVKSYNLTIVSLSKFQHKKIISTNRNNRIGLLFFSKEANLSFNDLVNFSKVVGSIHGNKSFFSYEPFSNYSSYFEVAAAKIADCNTKFYCGESFYRDLGKEIFKKNGKNANFVIAVYIAGGGIRMSVTYGALDFAMPGYSYKNNDLFESPFGEPQTVIVHETGHAFANLGDEYFENLYSARYNETLDVPNIDREGCPKWCNGTLDFSKPYYDAYANLKACLQPFIDSAGKLITGNDAVIGNCESTYQVKEMGGWENLELGSGCMNGAACYFNAYGLLEWRSSLDSIMKNNNAPNASFNKISSLAVEHRLREVLHL